MVAGWRLPGKLAILVNGWLGDVRPAEI
jgi:hypothetical protein